MSDRDDTRDTRDNTREYGSMFDPRAAGYPKGWHTHPRGANGLLIRTLHFFIFISIHTNPRGANKLVMIRQSWDPAVHGS